MEKAIKILTVVGARPQFIKAAVVSRAISRHNSTGAAATMLREEICHTGQHYDRGMSQVFFDEMGIPSPSANLGVGSGLHGETTAKMLIEIEREVIKRRPDLVLVYGDTNSTLAAALASAKLNLLLAHVEAGLRSFNRRMPEEINRLVTDHVAQLLFCPSVYSIEQLKREGITKGIHVVGDVMYDAFLHYSSKAISPSFHGPFVLATIHRAENTDDLGRLKGIMLALDDCPLPVVLSVHPRTRAALNQLRFQPRGSLNLTEPLSYFQMIGYLQASTFVVTDSGGLQKEAYFAEKRCITIRDETEWVELVEEGVNRIVGADEDRIKAAFRWSMEEGVELQSENLYGDGHSGEKIVQIILETLAR